MWVISPALTTVLDGQDKPGVTGISSGNRPQPPGLRPPRSPSPSPRRRRCRATATPRFRPRARRAPSSVTRMRAPEAPIGWPSAQAPPLTLTFSCGRPRSRIAAIATTAKASLISNRSTESLVQPVFSNSFLIAPIGAVGKSFGAAAWVACATIRASGAAAAPLRLGSSASGPAPRRRRRSSSNWPR